MRFLRVHEDPFFSMRYLNAGPQGGTVLTTLPMVRGEVDTLPEAIDGLLLTADLQGISVENGELSLLGSALARRYVELAREDKTLPAPERTGVILAGDLYSVPAANVRGATGDVRSVWTSFADRFAFV